MGKPALTIFTPAYNRAHTLGTLYESLCAQSCKDFEWILVNDGSEDNTEELALKWQKECKIDMKYIRCSNTGKMACHNTASDIAEGKLFMCLDSDDYLSSFSVVGDCISFWNDNNPSEEICGIISYKKVGEIVRTFPPGVKSSHLWELRKSGNLGESAIILRTDVVRNHKFPVFGQEKFVTDAFIYEQIDKDYRFLLMPSVTQICRYNPDGYSFNYTRLLFSNPEGYRQYHNQRISLGYEGKFKSAICWGAISIRMGFKGLFSRSASPALVVAALPFSFAKYLLDSIKLKTFGSLC